MTVENISIAVKTTGADTAARHINSLVASLEKLEKATASMTGVANLAELGKAFSTLASNRVSVSSFNSIAKGVERLGEALKSLSVEDAHILDKVTASMARLQGVDLKGFGSAVSAAHRVGEASQQAQMAVSEDVQSIIENASQVDILTHKLDGLKDALQEAFDTGNIEKAYALRGQILQVEDAIKRATEAAKKSSSAFGSFFASLKRIAMYRALRIIIKAITQAIKEGIDNLYEYSKAHDDFAGIASSFDGLASAAQTMKNQLGATFGQILAAAAPILIELMQLITQLTQLFYPLTQAISALTPVITAVIDVVTELVNVLIELFDLLGMNVGKVVADDATASWKEAKKAAGAYKNTILGFDEINRLNDTNGGGGGDAGGYSGGLGFSPSDLDWKFPEWFAIFKQNIDDCIGKIRDFVAELATIPDLVEVEIAIKDPLPDPLLALEPMLANIPVFEIEFAILGNPIPLLNSIRLTIANLVAECPQLQTAFQTAYNAIADVLGQLSEAYAQNVASIQIENSTLGQDVIDTYNRLKNPLDGWISHFWEKVGEYQQASGALQLENETLAQDMRTTFEIIKESVRTGLEGAKANVTTFVTQTLPSWVSWCNNVAENAMLAMENVATNIWASLQNAADNIVSFVNNTAQGFVSWAQSAAQSVFAWASNVLTNIGNALRGAWESIKSFAQATGEAIGGFFKENAQVIIPAAIGAAIVIGAIALAPPTGGASLAAIALAANGGVFPNDGTLFVAGEQGAEIVSNMGSGRTGVTNVEQMKEAVREGNFELLNVVQGGINIIVKAINEIDPDIQLDGQSLADKMYHYNQQSGRRYGVAMVT